MKYAHAQAIIEARDALGSIIEHAGSLSFHGSNPGAQGRLAGVAQVARDQLTNTLIVSKVWTNDEVAGGTLGVD